MIGSHGTSPVKGMRDIVLDGYRVAWASMRILSVVTPLLTRHSDLAKEIARVLPLANGDIVCVSSKAVALTEGASVELGSLAPSARALALQTKHPARSAAFLEAVLQETARLHGDLLPSCPNVLLTRLRPEGFPRGVILAANAGLDESNAETGTLLGWPLDPPASAKRLRGDLYKESGSRVAVMITDSCCHPARQGVTAQALAVSGMDPLRSLLGVPDLHGKLLRVTQEAVADQLATAANAVMGNAAGLAPAAVIREHGIPLTAFEGWVPGIEPEEDLFRMTSE